VWRPAGGWDVAVRHSIEARDAGVALDRVLRNRLRHRPVLWQNHPMDLRPAGPPDAATIAQLHADSWRRHYRGAYADSYLDGDIVAERRQVWSDRLAAGGHTMTVLAEDAGEPVGFVHVVFDADPRWGSLIDNLHVRIGRQRGGIGTALMARAADGIRERAAGKARYLWVLEQNTAAQGFYRALGGVRGELAVVSAPGGVPERLRGRPRKLRYSWSEVPGQ
jgi:ribosomal protein S18 acetylase RimI-like enzyme